VLSVVKGFEGTHANIPVSVRLSRKMGVKKEKQLWTSHRCFPGCVLEVVCLVRRWKYEKVAQVKNILGD
jgi:hypothetical protein